jgi:putative DNA methylase
MTTFSDLVGEVRERVLADALPVWGESGGGGRLGSPSDSGNAVGVSSSQAPSGPSQAARSHILGGERLEDGGAGAVAYADAVATYLGLGVSKMADMNNSLARWKQSMDQSIALFSRQAVPMVWDFAEVNPFAGAAGNLTVSLAGMTKVLDRLPAKPPARAAQADATSLRYGTPALSTDPPYYDNIGYSDLSDFFYVWLRRSLSHIQSKIVSTVLTPKADELVANPYRHEGKDGAERFFVEGFNRVFARVREDADPAGPPMTVYYAYKQQDAEAGGAASTGWTTLLQGLIGAGWEITATWPVRSELSNRMLASGTNALASSIVLACRPRPEDAPATTRRVFLGLLKAELPAALRAMMLGAVAPVDLAQAAVGPGMSIFSRYSRVREADGSDMPVREALTLINATLDEVIDAQEGDFDSDTRFAVKWYRAYGWNTESSGTADMLSRATGTSLAALERGGIFLARGGRARLVGPSELAGGWDPVVDHRVSVWEATVRLAAVLAGEGVDQVVSLLPAVGVRVCVEMVRELGFLLFHEAEKKGDSRDAVLFNSLVSSWGDLTAQARRAASSTRRGVQDTFDVMISRGREDD